MTGSVSVRKPPKTQKELDMLQKALAEQTKLAEDRLNQLKYLQADFDNYRKTFEKEKEAIIRLANENIAAELLPVLDGFEMALPSLESEKNKKGLTLLYQSLLKILEKHGLRPIEALGRKFDPHLHEVLCKEACDKEEGTVLEEIQKGFMLKSKVIRPSKVKIAENKQEGEEHG